MNNIRGWREALELTIEGLSEISGVSVASISAYETGKNEPSMEYLQKLSDATGIPKGMLLDVDPSGDPTLWSAFSRATDAQKRDMSRMAEGLVGPPPKPKPKTRR